MKLAAYLLILTGTFATACVPAYKEQSRNSSIPSIQNGLVVKAEGLG